MFSAGVLGDRSLTLEPLRASHAAEMTPVLADPILYEFTGGEPPSLETLRQRYVRQSRGMSPDGTEAWLNWIIRVVGTRTAAGFVQATISVEAVPVTAAMAWLIDPTHQGHGYARRASSLVIDALRTQGVTEFRASIADGHVASQRVATRLGMRRTGERDDDEAVWRL